VSPCFLLMSILGNEGREEGKKKKRRGYRGGVRGIICGIFLMLTRVRCVVFALEFVLK
jgi:hypothetical protein